MHVASPICDVKESFDFVVAVATVAIANLFFSDKSSFKLWDFLEALEDERTSAENTIIFLQDSDSDGD